jgi:serine/threonine protein kinase
VLIGVGGGIVAITCVIAIAVVLRRRNDAGVSSSISETPSHSAPRFDEPTFTGEVFPSSATLSSESSIAPSNSMSRDARGLIGDVDTEISEEPASIGASISDLIVDPSERIPIAEFTPLGGGFGVVYKCRHGITGNVSAVKEFASGELDSPAQFMEELEYLMHVRHPTIVGLIGFVMPEQQHHPKIVSEWVRCGSIGEFVSQRAKFRQLSGTMKMKAVVGICRGMKYIHACGGMRQCLKPSNILLNDKLEIRICVSGSAAFSDATPAELPETQLYAPPEAASCALRDRGDVYALGLIVWELLTGKTMAVAFQGMFESQERWTQRVRNGLRPPTDNLTSHALELLRGCWGKDPVGRWTFARILDYLKAINYDLFGAVDMESLNAYLSQLDSFEREHPPTSICMS